MMGARVTLVRVVEATGMDPVMHARLVPQLRLEAAEYLARAAEPLRPLGIDVTTVVCDGLAWEQIVETALRLKAKLIALTSHGRTGLSRWVLGSVAEKLIRTSPVPLFVLRSFGPGRGTRRDLAAPLTLRKVMVPLDGPLSESALEPAAALAKSFTASIVLVTVESGLDYPPGTYSARLVDPPAGPAAPSRVENADRLARAGDLLVSRGLTVVTLRVGGDVASRLLDLAKELGADAFAMASHGRRGIPRYLLGSITERVLRHSDLPMLIVPPAEDA